MLHARFLVNIMFDYISKLFSTGERPIVESEKPQLGHEVREASRKAFLTFSPEKVVDEVDA